LTELAAEVATCGSEGQDWGTGKEMIKWFFLDGVDTESGASTVSTQDHLAISIFANEAEAFIARVEVAMARAELAEDFLGSVFECRPPLSSDGSVCELWSSHGMGLG
jgi:hypothetical protein